MVLLLEVIRLARTPRNVIASHELATDSELRFLTMRKKVVVLGASEPVGLSLVEQLSKNEPEWEVNAVIPEGETLEQLEKDNVVVLNADIQDFEALQAVVDEMDVVYSCYELPQNTRKYWVEHWPPLIDNLLAVTSEERPLVFCDNLYAYGPGTQICTTTLPLKGSELSKPELRALMREKFKERMYESPKSIVVVGGSDLFGPGMGSKSFLGELFIERMVKGKKPLAIGSCENMHDFCYVPDLAHAAHLVSGQKDAYGRFWVCPHSVRGESMEDIAEEVNNHLDEEVEGVRVIAPWMLKSMSLFTTSSAELKEMLPWWIHDYTVDDREFTELFGVQATPFELAIKQTVQSYTSNAETYTFE